MGRLVPWSRVTAPVALAALLVATIACSSTVASPSVSPEPAPTPSAFAEPTPDATAPPTKSASPISTPVSATFESPFYRYAISLPPEIMTRLWRAAERQWDGAAKLDRAGPFVDRTGIQDGGIYVFGAEDPSLETWFARVEGNGRRFHGCSPAQDRIDVTINDTPAIAFTQGCENGTDMTRVALWKDGYGIGVWLEGAQISRLVELLATLEWKAP